jgi:hypothetical protein
MKKLVTMLAAVALALLLLQDTGSAQFAKGKNYVGAHVGLSGVGSTLTFGGDFERGITEKIGPGVIGVGATVDYWKYSFGYFGDTGDFSYRYISIGLLGNYHYILQDKKWDPWAGLVLGYYIVSASTPVGNYSGLNGSTIYLGMQLGCRYALNDKFDLQARLGFGPYIVAVGADFKF